MNAFKAGFINSQCCNHFPFTQLTQCHWLQTVDVQDRSWSCTPCSGAASRAVPPPRQHAPSNRRFTGDTRFHSTRRFVTGATCAYVCLRAQDDVRGYPIRSAIPASFTARGSVGTEYWR